MAAASTRQPARPPASVNSVLTSGLVTACYYAGARPDCQALASVRYGQIALCASCDQRRSTAGKGTPPVRLPDPHILLQVTAARDDCQQATAALHDTVASARPGRSPVEHRSCDPRRHPPGRPAALRPRHKVRKIS